MHRIALMFVLSLPLFASEFVYLPLSSHFTIQPKGEVVKQDCKDLAQEMQRSLLNQVPEFANDYAPVSKKISLHKVYSSELVGQTNEEYVGNWSRVVTLGSQAAGFLDILFSINIRKLSYNDGNSLSHFLYARVAPLNDEFKSSAVEQFFSYEGELLDLPISAGAHVMGKSFPFTAYKENDGLSSTKCEFNLRPGITLGYLHQKLP